MELYLDLKKDITAKQQSRPRSSASLSGNGKNKPNKKVLDAFEQYKKSEDKDELKLRIEKAMQREYE